MSFSAINCEIRIPKMKKIVTVSANENITTNENVSTNDSTSTSANPSTSKSTSTSTSPTTNIDSSIKTNHPKITVTQRDMLCIFANLTILFIGDNSIRTIYRDFVKIFSDGDHLLKNSEVKIQHGDYKEMEGEIRLQKGGTRGEQEYKDVRRYFCQSSATQLIYIYIPTVFGDIPLKNIDYLKTIKRCKTIHAVIFSLYHGDLNFAKLNEIKKPFKEYLKEYDTSLNNVCMHLMDICSNKKGGHQQKIWITPYPPNMKLTKQQKEQFKEIILHTDTITDIHGFKPFRRNVIRKKTHKNLLLKNSHYFSPKGIRLLTQLLAQIIGRRWERNVIE